MHIVSLALNHFRCHSTYDMVLNHGITVVVGANAQGKTSILEALFMIARGRGFREQEEHELLTWGETHGSIVARVYHTESAVTESAVVYQLEGHEVLRKRYTLDKAPVGLATYRKAQIPVVLFAPHHIDIVTHGPSYRREFLNDILSVTHPHYAQTLREYETALRKRNALLETYQTLETLRRDLRFWDEYLVSRADILHHARTELIEFFNTEPAFADVRMRITYLPNAMTQERLTEKFSTEAVAHRTLIGPQKDDFVLSIEQPSGPVNVHLFASRSQQRLSLLWLKMRELAWTSQAHGQKPILLLDDVYSEFDHVHKDLISQLIPAYQTIITTTEDAMLPAHMQAVSNVVKV